MIEIRDTTKDAFAGHESDSNDVAKSISALNKLKGVGPATSSLLLSCYDPIQVPFFSDELFRYLHWEEAKNKGWDRKITYTIKEYKDLFSKVCTFRSRIEELGKAQVSAIDIEKVAYVLGKEASRSKNSRTNVEAAEADKTLRPPSPKRRKKATPEIKAEPESRMNEDISPVEESRRKGVNGSPTYDKLGFELDKDIIIKHVSASRKTGSSSTQSTA